MLCKAKNIFVILVSFFIFFFSITVSKNAFAIDSRVKAVIVMSGYGTAGGALLGLSSYVLFRTSPRAIAQGASLGLYAGILFGGYIIGSHEMSKNQKYDPQPSRRRDNYENDGTNPDLMDSNMNDFGSNDLKNFNILNIDEGQVFQEKFQMFPKADLVSFQVPLLTILF